jgi:hypothetical protein
MASGLQMVDLNLTSTIFCSKTEIRPFAWEMYVASFSSNTEAFADRIERERKRVEVMLIDHLSDSDIVYDLACYAASEDEQ